jgi:hypothetical protein
MGPRSIQAARPEDGEGPQFRAIPFSGGERNRIFMSRGNNFKDLTLVSGVDFRDDGRGFALLDYDQDGFMDLAIASPNAPRFRIVKNKMNSGSDIASNSFVEVSLVGGQTTKNASRDWSSRDAFGAKVIATIDGTKRAFQLSCGEGLSSQNTKRIHIGMGAAEKIEEIVVHWPSGKETVVKDVLAGKRLTIHENEAAISVGTN